MKKYILYFTVLSGFISAQNIQSCLINYSKYKNLSNQEILYIAKHCRMPENIKNLSIQNKKTLYIPISIYKKKKIKHQTSNINNTKPHTSISNNIKTVTVIIQQKTKTPTIKHSKPRYTNLANFSLPELLKYAIKHNLTDSYIGKLIIKKSANSKYEDLDTDYIKHVFSKKYTKEDLQNLLNAIKTLN